MAILSVGYDGPVDEVGSSKLFPTAGSSEYGVVGENDWVATAHPSTAQAINLSIGRGWGHGVYDESDTVTTVQCEPITSGTRWDLIVMDRDWQPLNGLSQFGAVTGGATKALPDRVEGPGVRDQQPLWLVQWQAGQTQPIAFVDLRVWAGNGGMVGKDELVRSYLETVGTRIKINGEIWSFEPLSNGTADWVNEDGSGPWVDLPLKSGWRNIGIPARARLIARGALVHVECEVVYDGGAAIYEGWIIAELPGGMKPKYATFVAGSTNQYRSGAFYIIYSGGLAVGPAPVGKVCQFNGIAAMK